MKQKTKELLKERLEEGLAFYCGLLIGFFPFALIYLLMR